MAPSSAAGGPRGARHPAHDEIAAALRGWHTASVPEAGIVVVDTWYGCDRDAHGSDPPRVLLTIDRVDEVQAALADAYESLRTPEIGVYVTDRGRTELLEEALLAAGCERVRATTHLTLVGELHARTGPDGLCMEAVESADLPEWAALKIKCFEDTEGEPTPEQLSRELTVRSSDAALETLRLARLGDEVVGVLGYYAGDDQLVFNLGTRVPFRHRGIAQAMLACWAREGAAAGCRSLTINATDPGRPADLYRRLGFTDEVYWQQHYRLLVNDDGVRTGAATAVSP
jgi:hypothetical protein